jgi:SnoaL-like domain
MSTATDSRILATAVMRDGDSDLGAFFGHFAENCRFAWSNEQPVQGLEAIQALVGKMLAGVSSVRHDIIEFLLNEDRDGVALRMDVTYTFQDGSEIRTPAVTYMRFSHDRIVEYLIYQDPTPVARAAGR